jgi:hypothetical protein
LCPGQLLNEHKFTSVVISSFLRKHKYNLERKIDIAIQILMQGVKSIFLVPKDEWGRTLLILLMTARNEFGVFRGILLVDAQHIHPTVCNGLKFAIKVCS